MVLLIAESLIEPRSDDVMIEASNILKRLEKRGMIPPIEDGRTVQDLDLGVPTWDDEDEKLEERYDTGNPNYKSYWPSDEA